MLIDLYTLIVNQQHIPGADKNKVKRQTAGSSLAVIPYVNNVSHNIRKMEGKGGVQVVFSAPQKVGGRCRKVSHEGPTRKTCEKKQVRECAEVRCGVVNCITLSFGCPYIGQPGPCINLRLREHELSFGD